MGHENVRENLAIVRAGIIQSRDRVSRARPEFITAEYTDCLEREFFVAISAALGLCWAYEMVIDQNEIGDAKASGPNERRNSLFMF